MDSTNFFVTQDYESSDDDSEEIRILIAKAEAKAANGPEDPETVARNARQKPYNQKLRAINNDLMTGNYTSAVSSLLKLISELDKNSHQVNKDGYPPLLFKTMLSIQQKIDTMTSKDKARISKEQKNSMTKLRKENTKLLERFEPHLKTYKSNPILSDGEESSSEEPAAVEPVVQAPKSSSSSSKSDDDDSASSFSADTESEVEVVQTTKELTRQEKRLKWLKVAPVNPEPKETNEPNKPQRQPNRLEGNRNPKEHHFIIVDQDFSKIDLGDESIHRRLTEMATKRTADIDELESALEILEYIFSNATTPKRKLEVIILLLNFKSEIFRGDNQSVNQESWNTIYDKLQDLLAILKSEAPFLEASVNCYLKDEPCTYTKKELDTLYLSALGSLDTDWFSLLIKVAHPESIEYATLLRDEIKLLSLLKDSLEYFEMSDNKVSTGHIAFRLLNHVYYMSDNTLARVQTIVANFPIKASEVNYVQTLTSMVYNKVNDSSTVTKTALLEAYNHAINNRFLEAKDHLHMYNIPEKSGQDNQLGFMYNRALTALGLCAFRLGKLEQTQDILEELCNSGKLRDLLNQANMRGYIDREERRNYTPYHMSVSIENVESAYYVSVMLNEAPILAAQLSDSDRRSNTSKLFQRLWLQYEKNPLCGPPENHRDLVYCAVKELLRGDWEQCYKHICKLKIWNSIDDAQEHIKKTYQQLIKEQAYKTFIFSIRNTYHVLKFNRLAELFALSADKLVNFTCSMIYSGELQAKLDPVSGCLVTGRREQGDLEGFSEKLSQRVYSMMHLNEKLFDVKFAEANFSELMQNTETSGQMRAPKKAKPTVKLPIITG